MQGRFPAARTAIGRIRSKPLLVGVGVLSVPVTFLALFGTAQVLGQPRGGSPPELVVSLTGAIVVAGAVRSLFLAPILAVGVPGMRSPADRTGETDREGWSGRLASIASRTGDAALAVPLVYAAGVVVGGLALVPVLAGYGLAVTALQGVGWWLTGGPLVSTGLVVAGVVFLAMPAAAAVGVGAVGFAVPAAAGGRSPTTALREGIGRFLAAPRRWIGRGLAVVGLLFAPLAVLVVGGWFGLVEGATYEVSIGAALFVAAVCYTLGPVYRTVASEPGFRDPGDGAVTGRAGPVPGDGPALPVRTAVAVVVLSSVVLGSVGAVRVADARPVPDATPPPGYDRGAAPGERVAAGMSYLAAADHETRRLQYGMENGTDGSWQLERRGPFRFDVGNRRVAMLAIGRGSDDRELYATKTYADRSVVLRRRADLTGDLTAMVLDPGEPLPDGASEPTPWRRASANAGLFEDAAVEVPTATRLVRALADAGPETFRAVGTDGDRVVLETVDTAAYCRVVAIDCAGYSVTDGRVRVVLDAETGVPVGMTATRTQRRPNPDPDESPTFRTRREYRFDVHEVTVTRPRGTPQDLTELLFDAFVY